MPPGALSDAEAAYDAPQAWHDLQSLSAERLLVLLGGASALVFGLLVFVMEVAQGRAFEATSAFGPGGVVLAFVLTLLFGLLLLHAVSLMGRTRGEGAVLAFAFSIVLLMFGGAGGAIGGLLGIVGAAFALVKNVKLTA